MANWVLRSRAWGAAALGLALGLIASACAAPPTPTCRVGVGGGPAGIPLVLAGAEATVKILGATAMCDAVALDGLTLESRVLRADGTELKNPSAVVSAERGTLAVTMRFTPDQPGTWQVQARVQPNRGDFATAVEVAEDFSKRTGRPIFAEGSDCQRFEAVSATDTLCHDGTLRLTLYRSGSKRDEVSASGYSLADDTVWTLGGSRVHRYALSTGSFVDTAVGDFLQGGNAVVHALGSDRALVSEGATHLLLRFDGSAVLNAERRPSGLVPSGKFLFSVDGNQLLAADDTRACASALDSNAAPRCAPIDYGSPWTADAEGIWFGGNTQRVLRLIPHAATGLPAPLALDLPEFVEFPGGIAPEWESSPRLVIANRALALARRGPNGLVLESWGALVVRRASRKRLYGSSTGIGPWSVYERP